MKTCQDAQEIRPKLEAMYKAVHNYRHTARRALEKGGKPMETTKGRESSDLVEGRNIAANHHRRKRRR